jgi:hypothetical protein
MILSLNDPDDLAFLAIAPTSNINRPPSGAVLQKVARRKVALVAHAPPCLPWITARFVSMPMEEEETGIRSVLTICANDSLP